MKKTKVSIQFGSIYNLWKFRNAIHINAFFVDIEKLTLTFEYVEENEIGWAIEKYYGQVVVTMQKA